MDGQPRLDRHLLSRGAVTMALLIAPLGIASGITSQAPTAVQAVTTASACQLNAAGGTIKHVIDIQFDNTHWSLD